MPDRVQVGPKVDEELWHRFRENVKRRKGQIRGSLGSEVENALRQYIDGDPDAPSEEISARLARIESELEIAEADGGTDVRSGQTHTRADPVPDEKPEPNTARSKKIAWLADRVRESNGGEIVEIPRSDIREVVKNEYGFRKDTAKRYVDALTERFNLVDHPSIDMLLVTEERRRELIEQEADQKL